MPTASEAAALGFAVAITSGDRGAALRVCHPEIEFDSMLGIGGHTLAGRREPGMVRGQTSGHLGEKGGQASRALVEGVWGVSQFQAAGGRQGFDTERGLRREIEIAARFGKKRERGRVGHILVPHYWWRTRSGLRQRTAP